MTQYITNARISRARYTIMHFKHHHRVLQLNFNRINAIIEQFTYTLREVKKLRFGILFLLLFLVILLIFLLLQYRPSAIVSHLLTLVYMRAVWCANGFVVTRPFLNRSFTIGHAVSLPLRRHYRTQSQLQLSNLSTVIIIVQPDHIYQDQFRRDRYHG